MHSHLVCEGLKQSVEAFFSEEILCVMQETLVETTKEVVEEKAAPIISIGSREQY